MSLLSLARHTTGKSYCFYRSQVIYSQWRIYVHVTTRNKNKYPYKNSIKVLRIYTREPTIDLEPGRFLNRGCIHLFPKGREDAVSIDATAPAQFTLQAFGFCVCHRFSFFDKSIICWHQWIHTIPLTRQMKLGAFILVVSLRFIGPILGSAFSTRSHLPFSKSDG